MIVIYLSLAVFFIIYTRTCSATLISASIQCKRVVIFYFIPNLINNFRFKFRFMLDIGQV